MLDKKQKGALCADRGEHIMSMLRIKNICSLFLPFCLFLITGCATTSDMDAMKNSVGNLQLDSMSQKKEVSAIRDKLELTTKDVTALKEYSMLAMKDSQSSILTQTADLSKEVQVLKGRFDESKYYMDKTLKDLLSERELQQAKIAGLENQIKDLKNKVGKAAAPEEQAKSAEKTQDTPQEPASSSQKKEEVSTADNDAQKLYDDARKDYDARKYAEARQKFEKFTKDFHKHSLAGNALFWVGETFYAEKKYDDAILTYESFLKKYPQNEKTRSAMLKQAYAFIGIDDKKTAKVILERLIEKYPRSPEAAQAEQKIGEILAKNKGSVKKKKR